MDIKELKTHLDTAHTEVKNLVERQSAEIKTLGTTSSETAAKLKSATERLDQVTKDFEGRVQEIEKRMDRPDGGSDHQAKSAGEIFITSKAFTEAKGRGLNATDAVEIKSIVDSMQRKDITSGSSSAGAIAQSHRVNEIYRDPADRELHIRDLLGTSETSSGSIEYYVDHTGFTNNAAAQAAELATKGKSDLVLEAKTAAVRTIAHHVIASRQVLEDAPMLRSYIDGRLRHGLLLEEDTQILYGDGTGGTLEGIFNTTGVQNHGDRPVADDVLTHLRRAMTKARLSEYMVDGIIMHPTDWENIELLKSDDGHFVWMWYMASNGDKKVFRVPVVETTAVAQGDFLLGNWSMAATLWDRRQANIRVSDSHADLFVKNGVAILGEERVALTVQRPSAFVKGSFDEVVQEPEP